MRFGAAERPQSPEIKKRSSEQAHGKELHGLHLVWEDVLGYLLNDFVHGDSLINNGREGDLPQTKRDRLELAVL